MSLSTNLRTLTYLTTGLASLALASGSAGCTPSAALEISDPAQLQTLVAQKDKPLLVLFYKEGCASCLALMPTIDRLAQEYAGRANVAQYMILTFAFGVTNQDVKDRYEVILVPHVVLLVNGQEKARWVMDYNIDSYRKALDESSPATAQAGKSP